MKTIIKNIPYAIWGIIKMLLFSIIVAVIVMGVCMGLVAPISTYTYIYKDGVEYMSAWYVYLSSIIGVILYLVVAYVLFRPETEKEIADREQRHRDVIISIIRNNYVKK